MNQKKKPPKTAETIAQILVNVLIRHFTADKPENGEEKTGISPQCMAPQQHH